MNTATHPRTRLSATPAGKSGAHALRQDVAQREALKQADIRAYQDFLATGGRQPVTTAETPDVLLQLEIAELFGTHSWGEYAGATL